MSFVDCSVKTMLSQLATSFCCTTPRGALQDEKLEFSFRVKRFLFGIQTELRRKTAKLKSNDRRFKGRTTLIIRVDLLDLLMMMELLLLMG